jgi:hypothetical protein
MDGSGANEVVRVQVNPQVQGGGMMVEPVQQQQQQQPIQQQPQVQQAVQRK